MEAVEIFKEVLKSLVIVHKSWVAVIGIFKEDFMVSVIAEWEWYINNKNTQEKVTLDSIPYDITKHFKIWAKIKDIVIKRNTIKELLFQILNYNK